MSKKPRRQVASGVSLTRYIGIIIEKMITPPHIRIFALERTNESVLATSL